MKRRKLIATDSDDDDDEDDDDDPQQPEPLPLAREWNEGEMNRSGMKYQRVAE
jgi:hypothetical protein